MNKNTPSWEEQFDEEIGGLWNVDGNALMNKKVKAFIAKVEARAIRDTIAKTNLHAVEILHKYAMQTTNTAELNLIEAAQKEILSSLTPNDQMK